MESTLFSEYKLGDIILKNRVVMAPMTRARAEGNIPNDIMVKYYSLRADAGLIITEGVAPSPNGIGYPRVPGLFNEQQVSGWKKITDAVHSRGGRIFAQLMHAGRIAHPSNMPAGTRILAPSALRYEGVIFNTEMNKVEPPVPEEMNINDINQAIDEFVSSAELAVEAGFDGIELHGGNGYLIEQFINRTTNHRTDLYGGSIENRVRFAVTIAEKAAAKIGRDKIGIRVSPYGISNGMVFYEDIDETYTELAKAMDKIGIAYIHIIDHSGAGAPPVKPLVKKLIRDNFSNTVILSGGYDAQKAEDDLRENKGNLIAFGKPFISNPDFVNRLKNGFEILKPDFTTFYTAGVKGYLDYPVLS
jgi:N-ethylmaleimide reductase